MKTSLLISFFLLTLFQQFAIGQASGEKHFYVNSANEIETVYFDEIKDEIALIVQQEETNSIMGVSSALFGIVIGELVPILVEKVGFLAYNPKNYISEYGKSYLFKKDSLINLNNIRSIVFTRTGLENGSEKMFSFFGFDLTDVSKPNSEKFDGYKTIALMEHQNNFTKVKLKNSGRKMSVVIEVIITYYDLEDKKQELNLQPYKLSGIISKGSNGESIQIARAKRNYQIIPPMRFIESIGIKVTEVNDRKKDWDKYLELFNDQKGNISNFLIDQLK